MYAIIMFLQELSLDYLKAKLWWSADLLVQASRPNSLFKPSWEYQKVVVFGFWSGRFFG